MHLKKESKTMPFLGSFHGMDLLVVLIVALLVFGPKRLPELGSAVGKTFTAFKKSMNEAVESNKTQEVALPVAVESSQTEELEK